MTIGRYRVFAFGIRVSTFGQVQKSRSRESRVEELRTFRPSTSRLANRARFLATLGMTRQPKKKPLTTASFDGKDLPPSEASEEGLDVAARNQTLDFTIGDGGVWKRELTLDLGAECHEAVKPPARSRPLDGGGTGWG